MNSLKLFFRLLGISSFFVICVLSEDVNFDTLKQVQIIFRHGERTPEYPYPTDQYNADGFWKEGWGQLTEKGKKQEFELGEYLRSRYQNFISDNFVADELYVLSSDTDRTIMSSELCLAGLFPTVNGTYWNSNLNWQPIPLHTIATENDNILRCKKPCPKYDTLFKDVLYNSAETLKLNAENNQLFEYLSNHSGVNITNIDDIDQFYASMMAEEILGLPLPDWAVDVVNTENFQYMYNLSFSIKSSTPELKRLRTGPLLNSVLSHFQDRVKNESMKTKFFMYSAHDTTLVNILNTLDILDLQRPSYASVFMLELHKSPESNNYTVHILYRNETGNEPYKLQLPECPIDCPFQEFETILEPLIPTDWEAECQLATSKTTSILTYIIIGAVALFLVGFIYCILSKLICRKEKRPMDYEKI